MRKTTCVVFLFLLFFGTQAWADDIIHATSEDIAEFDQFLANDPSALDKPDKPKKPKGEKGDKPEGNKPPPKPREQFQGKVGPGGNASPGGMRPPRKGPPRDDRERGRRKPPPPPGSMPPPPPPPPN